MKFQFKNASCVVIGTFNVFVIQPKLLTEMGLIRKGTSIKVEQDLSQPGTRIQVDEVTWVVRPDRLIVESKRYGEDCGTPLAELLSKLLWTPVFAVGVNLAFTGVDIEESEIPDGFRLPKVEFETTQRTVHACIADKERVFNVQLAASKTQDSTNYELALNIHTDFSEKKSSHLQASLNQAATLACRQFFDDIAEITKFSKNLCPSLQFSYDIDNEHISVHRQMKCAA